MAIDRNLAAFIAVVEQGNVSAAAHAIGLAQPSLTKRLKLLEQEYGAALFERLPRGMAPTAIGRLLYDHAKRIEQGHLQAREAVRAARSDHLEVLRVGAGPLFRRAYLAEAFQQLRQEFPDTRLELTGDVHLRNLPRLRQGELDLVFGAVVADVTENDIETHAVGRVRLGALAHRDHALASGGPVRAPDLAAIDWVLYSNDPETTSMVRGFFIRHGIAPPAFAVTTSSYEFGLSLVATGHYVMPAPEELDASFAPLGLKSLPLSEPIDTFPAGVYVRRASLGYPVVARLIDLVKGAKDGQGTARI